MDGRVLAEAMNSSATTPTKVAESFEATRKFPTGTWHQQLQISRVDSTVYLDEGNGGFSR
jgi:hypothetical protein